MNKSACIFLVLSACTATPELQPFERASIAAVAQSWRETGLPEPTQGRCDVSSVHIRIDSAQAFADDCHANPAHNYGCTAWTSGSQMFRWRDEPVVVIAPWWHSEPNIIVHELLHAYSRCAGVGPSAADDEDSQHRNPRVWEAAGGASSVQARAMAIVAKTTAP